MSFSGSSKQKYTFGSRLLPQEEMLEVGKKEQRLTIGLPKEDHRVESRIALTPEAIEILTGNEHEVFIESDAGLAANYTNTDYSEKGGIVVDKKEEVYQADIILKISAPTLAESELLRAHQTIISSLHLNLQSKELIKNLINEFATFARLPAANPEPCDLSPLIYETIALYKEGHPSIRFSARIPDDVPVMQLDRQQIKQILINLIDNAIASIRTTGEISVAVAHSAEEKIVRLVVTDTGSGVPDNVKPSLFEPDFTTKKSGMGLGLAIVSTIVSDHKGKIHVEDNEPRGARFVIELPV